MILIEMYEAKNTNSFNKYLKIVIEVDQGWFQSFVAKLVINNIVTNI